MSSTRSARSLALRIATVLLPIAAGGGALLRPPRARIPRRDPQADDRPL